MGKYKAQEVFGKTYTGKRHYISTKVTQDIKISAFTIVANSIIDTRQHWVTEKLGAVINQIKLFIEILFLCFKVN